MAIAASYETTQETGLSTAEIKELNNAHIINTYGDRALALTRGSGVHLWDADGKEYLDFFAGIAVANLGHCHPAVTQAIQDQAAKLIHVSNLYYIEPQAHLAQILANNCFAHKWFFCNGGAEANEAALKLARRYWAKKGTPKPGIIAAEKSFHGRTLATVTLTGQPKYHEGFEPLLPGVSYVPYNDIEALANAVKPETGAIILEPIQGEGGVNVPDDNYLSQARALCDEKGILLIFDEVQTGLGRTGKLFAYEHSGVTPDIITLAKGLGNGVPIGAMGCTVEAATGFDVGSHACTFGGNPLSAAAAVATLTTILDDKVVENAAEVGEYMQAKLRTLAEEFDSITEVRGKGLMIGLALSVPAGPIVTEMIQSGVICGPAGPNVLRFVPPLIITEEHVDQMIQKLNVVLAGVTS